MNVKREGEKKVYAICVLAALIVGLAGYFLVGISPLNAIVLTGCWFFAVRYCIFGQKEWYAVKTFKHHMVLRWIAVIFLAVYTLMGIAIFVFEDPENFTVIILYLPMFLICAIQSVMNGKRAQKGPTGRRLNG